jgi:hypothetical protein
MRHRTLGKLLQASLQSMTPNRLSPKALPSFRATAQPARAADSWQKTRKVRWRFYRPASALFAFWSWPARTPES